MATNVGPRFLSSTSLIAAGPTASPSRATKHAVVGEQAGVAGVVAGIEVLGVVDEDLADLLAIFELLKAVGVGHDRVSPFG